MGVPGGLALSLSGIAGLSCLGRRLLQVSRLPPWGPSSLRIPHSSLWLALERQVPNLKDGLLAGSHFISTAHLHRSLSWGGPLAVLLDSSGLAPHISPFSNKSGDNCATWRDSVGNNIIQTLVDVTQNLPFRVLWDATLSTLEKCYFILFFFFKEKLGLEWVDSLEVLLLGISVILEDLKGPFRLPGFFP